MERVMIRNTLPGLDYALGSDVDMLRETVGAFAQAKIAPGADDIDRSNKFPRDLWPELGALGLLGITVEEEWSGSGLGYLAHCVAMEEISRASAAVDCLMARIPIFASIRSGAMAVPSRKNGICPS